MPGKRGRSGLIGPQTLWHPGNAVLGSGDEFKIISASQLSLITSRPCRARELNFEWVSGSAEPNTISVEVLSPNGEVVARSRPLLTSFTVQRITLRVPPSTDFGDYAPADIVVRINKDSLVNSGSVSASMSLHIAYKPACSASL
jgi:hypothetical protein